MYCILHPGFEVEAVAALNGPEAGESGAHTEAAVLPALVALDQMSPLSTFHSCGHSSMENLRSQRPTAVMRGSSGILKTSNLIEDEAAAVPTAAGLMEDGRVAGGGVDEEDDEGCGGYDDLDDALDDEADFGVGGGGEVEQRRSPRNGGGRLLLTWGKISTADRTSSMTFSLQQHGEIERGVGRVRGDPVAGEEAEDTAAVIAGSFEHAPEAEGSLADADGDDVVRGGEFAMKRARNPRLRSRLREYSNGTQAMPPMPHWRVASRTIAPRRELSRRS